MKAIETRYAGYRFRSRTEARWAVFLDSIGWAWEYEKEGYELHSGSYLPDFYVRVPGGTHFWLEIKGGEPTVHELVLCAELHEALNEPVVITHGLPGDLAQLFFAKQRMGVRWSQLNRMPLRLCVHPLLNGGTVPACVFPAPFVPCSHERAHEPRQLQAAKLARFEHGQTGLEGRRRKGRRKKGSRRRG